MIKIIKNLLFFFIDLYFFIKGLGRLIFAIKPVSYDSNKINLDREEVATNNTCVSLGKMKYQHVLEKCTFSSNSSGKLETVSPLPDKSPLQGTIVLSSSFCKISGVIYYFLWSSRIVELGENPRDKIVELLDYRLLITYG